LQNAHGAPAKKPAIGYLTTIDLFVAEKGWHKTIV
jgi:hypothetical protein